MNLRRFPFVWILLVLWATLRSFQIDMSFGSAFGTSFVVAGLIVVVIEFYKSADIGLKTFKIEKATSAIASVVWGLFMGYILGTSGLSGYHFCDFVIGVVVFLDDWLSPSASFAMALRNLAGNVGDMKNPEGE